MARLPFPRRLPVWLFTFTKGYHTAKNMTVAMSTISTMHSHLYMYLF